MSMRLSKGLVGTSPIHQLARGKRKRFYGELILTKPFLGAAARLRPSLPIVRAAVPAISNKRFQSTGVPADPKTKAQSILDSLPGQSLASKAAILSSGAGISIAAISNEIYVVNEESIVAFCLLSVFWAIGKYGTPLYSQWATGQVTKIRDILNAARVDHTEAVKERIESVSQMSTVVEVTKDLFAVSKVLADSCLSHMIGNIPFTQCTGNRHS